MGVCGSKSLQVAPDPGLGGKGPASPSHGGSGGSSGRVAPSPPLPLRLSPTGSSSPRIGGSPSPPVGVERKSSTQTYMYILRFVPNYVKDTLVQMAADDEEDEEEDRGMRVHHDEVEGAVICT